MKVNQARSNGLLKKVQRGIRKDPSFKSKLAAFIGYRSTNAIDKWVERGSVPRLQRERVEAFLDIGGAL